MIVSRGKMITIGDIAAKLGISKTTVSLVLNNRGEALRISNKTRDAVLATAREMGFRRNALARSVATGKSNVIGFITKEAKSKYNAEALSGAMLKADANKFLVKLLLVTAKVDGEAIADTCIENRLAGVIVCRSMENNQLTLLLERMREFNIPVSVIGDEIISHSGIEVDTDSNYGCALAVEYLHCKNRRKIAIVAIHPHLHYSQVRAANFKRTLRKLKLKMPENYFINVPYMEDLEDRLEEFCNSVESIPNGILCISDPVAMVTMRFFRKKGYRIPEDISIIGYGNLDMGLYSDVTLTTIDEPYEQIGKTAAELLIKQIKNPNFLSGKNKVVKKLLKGSLIQRES